MIRGHVFVTLLSDSWHDIKYCTVLAPTQQQHNNTAATTTTTKDPKHNNKKIKLINFRHSCKKRFQSCLQGKWRTKWWNIKYDTAPPFTVQPIIQYVKIILWLQYCSTIENLEIKKNAVKTCEWDCTYTRSIHSKFFFLIPKMFQKIWLDVLTNI